MTTECKAWHRRHAIQLAAQLPEDVNDARCVLDALSEILDTFLTERPEPAPDYGDRVVSFGRGLRPTA